MHHDTDFDLAQGSPWNERDLMQDLELDILFQAMAAGDRFLYEMAKKVLLCGMSNDPDTILYRQDVLMDCLNNASVVRSIYDVVVEAIESRKKYLWGFFNARYPASILHNSRQVLEVFMDILERLRSIADMHAGTFHSEGFTTFFDMLKRELSDAYFEEVYNHLRALKFRNGVFVSAELGRGNMGANYTLMRPHDSRQSWLRRIFPRRPVGYVYTIEERDDCGAQALSTLRDRGINLVAHALAQSCDHIYDFFIMVRTELAFYVGCLNLHGKLDQKGVHVTFPAPVHREERRHSVRDLHDVCLELTPGLRTVGNDLRADGKTMVIVTGANQGGKSTFLRAIGLAQLMMQSGMFVTAETFCSNVCDGIFTHYRRKEDASMNSGKLDEELGRMSSIVDRMTKHSLLLLNESFAATNEREGSEISRQIVSVMLEKGVKVFYVTHGYTFAHGLYEEGYQKAIFLRADRHPDRSRTYRLIEGEPLQTSYGEDLYTRIFSGNDEGRKEEQDICTPS